jgi:hypothetical protein
MSKPKGAKIDRREFMGRTAAVAAGITILKSKVAFGSQANSAVRIALLGCGGRGSGVMSSFLEHTGAVLVAIGDAFPDQLDKAKTRLDEQSAKFGKPALAPSKLYKGLNAYQSLFADKDVDASHIDVDTEAATRTVMLKGTVPSAAQKTTAERIAKSKVSKGYSVHNMLTVSAKS